MRKPVFDICEQQRPDQPVHPRSLISAFVVHYLDSITPLVSISEIASLYLASLAALVCVLPGCKPQRKISHDETQMLKPHCSNFRIITVIFSGNQIFQILTVHLTHFVVVHRQSTVLRSSLDDAMFRCDTPHRL